MTVRQDILTAARGGMPERVPWTIYPNMLPVGEAERTLRNAGLGFAYSMPFTSPQIFEWGPNVEVAERRTYERGQTLRHIRYRTPVGELSEVRRSTYAPEMSGMVSDWKIEFMVKKPADYEVLEFMIRDQVFCPSHDQMRRLQQQVGDDGVIIAKVGGVRPSGRSQAGRARHGGDARAGSQGVDGNGTVAGGADPLFRQY